MDRESVIPNQAFDLAAKEHKRMQRRTDRAALDRLILAHLTVEMLARGRLMDLVFYVFFCVPLLRFQMPFLASIIF
jgi:hypothetical protein